MYHYYLSAKYFPELGYYDLYRATLLADAQLPKPLLKRLRWVREQREYQLVRTRGIRRDADLQGRFSAERWDEFRDDVAYFEGSIPFVEWRHILRDHGYNAPPSRTALTGPIASALGPASDLSITALSLIDPAILAALFLAIHRAFGLGTAALVAIAFGTNRLATFDWIGGSFARFDWFVLCGLGVIALRRKRHFLAGALLGGAAMLRLFPALFALAVLARGLFNLREVRCWESRYRRFLLGLFSSGMGLALLSLLFGGGAEAWGVFYSKITHHADGLYANHVGLRALVEGSAPSLWLARAVVAGLFLGALRRTDDAEAALLGGVLVFTFTFVAGYYYSFLALFFLSPRGSQPAQYPTSDPSWDSVGFFALLFAPSLAVIAIESVPRHAMSDVHFAASAALVFTFAALFWWTFDVSATLRSRWTSPPPE